VEVLVSADHGDPASCSQAGGSLRRLASRLRSAADAVAAAAEETVQGEPGRGRGARDLARRRQALVETTRALAGDLDRTGSELQSHAADLAESVQELRDLQGRAEAVGLRVVDGRVELAWGVQGVADAGDAATREEQRLELQADAERAAVVLHRRRARLATSLESARDAAARHGVDLRG
jgi:hypothetical protein